MQETIYVLLALYITGTPRPVTWSAEFTTKERCERAAQQLGEAARATETRYKTDFVFVCTEK